MNWLLLRGLAREQRHWHAFADRLKSRVAGRVALADLAGVGTERRRLPRPSVEWLARDVAQRVADFTASGERAASWTIVGLSLGGMIALELCRLYPELVERAVVINASSRLTRAWKRLRPPAAFELLRLSLSTDALYRERRVLALTSMLPALEREAYARSAAQFARDAPPSRGSVLAQLAAAARFVPPSPAALTAMLAFVCARNDKLVSPRCSRDLAAWYGAPSTEHPWAGHDLPLDDPDWLCDRIVQPSAGTA